MNTNGKHGGHGLAKFLFWNAAAAFVYEAVLLVLVLNV
jgi:hypothetical protein